MNTDPLSNLATTFSLSIHRSDCFSEKCAGSSLQNLIEFILRERELMKRIKRGIIYARSVPILYALLL
jgi:hypothetical protein